MESGTQSVAGRLLSETVNDVLPGDPGSIAGKRRHGPELPETVKRTSLMAAEALGDPFAAQRLPETVPLAIDGSGGGGRGVVLPEIVARLLLFGADAFREAWNAAIESEDPAFADLILQHIDELVAAGIVSSADGRTTEAFDAACQRLGSALGSCVPHAAIAAPAGRAVSAGATPARSPLAPNTTGDDGEGIDQLAGDNDDGFEDDVRAAEGQFSDAEPRLPAAASFPD